MTSNDKLEKIRKLILSASEGLKEVENERSPLTPHEFEKLANTKLPGTVPPTLPARPILARATEIMTERPPNFFRDQVWAQSKGDGVDEVALGAARHLDTRHHKPVTGGFPEHEAAQKRMHKRHFDLNAKRLAEHHIKGFHFRAF